jgi:hypothetical protein
MMLGVAVLVSQSPLLELSGRRLQVNFTKTRLGMTRTEIETILGEPLGGSGPYPGATWEDSYFIARLWYDNDGRLCHAHGVEKHVENPVRELFALPSRLLNRWW